MINFFFDMETVPDQKPLALEKLRADITAPGQYKKQESIDKWLAEHAQSAAEEAHHKTSLNGISGEICSIAWAVDDDAINGIVRYEGMSEEELLRRFFFKAKAELDDALLVNRTYINTRWIGHNVLDFDIRFLYQRCLVNKIRPSFDMPIQARPFSDNVFDTMRQWCGWKGYVSQQALCEAFGIKGKSDMDGSMVWQAYQDGKFEEILAYNKDDVRIVRELYWRMS